MKLKIKKGPPETPKFQPDFMATIDRRTTRNKTRYRARVRVGGIHKTRTFDKRTSAAQWASETEARIREGKMAVDERARLHTLREAVERFLQDVLPYGDYSAVYRKETKRYLKWWSEKLGDVALSDLKSDYIAGARDEILRRNSTSSANRHLAALSRLFKVAYREWRWINEKPTDFVSYVTEPPGRVRYLSQDELQKLLEACRKVDEKILYPVVVLAISAGPRKSEILNIQVEDVDIDRQTVVIQKTKNKTQRQIHLSGLALKLISERCELCEKRRKRYLFHPRCGDGPVDITARWYRALRLSGVNGFRFHDLRHTAASYLAMTGATHLEIAEILGHKKLDMVRRYAHLSKSKTDDVVEKMNDFLLGSQNEK